MAGHSPASQWHYGPVAPYCCEMMRSNIEKVCEQHDHAEDCPDRLGTFVPKFNEFGLPVHDGGSSYVIIEYCPWCGRKLPESALWSLVRRTGTTRSRPGYGCGPTRISGCDLARRESGLKAYRRSDITLHLAPCPFVWLEGRTARIRRSRASRKRESGRQH